MESTEHCQELDESGGFQSAAINRLALLTLNNVTEPPPPTAANRCAMCGSSVKRRSPSSSFLQEPTAKKQLILLTPPPTAAAADKHLPPISFQISPPSPNSTFNSLPILRRCVSDPINSPGTTNARAPPIPFLNSQSPENTKTNHPVSTPSPPKASTSLPPLPRALRRSVSDPTQSPYQLTTDTTLPHTSPRTPSQSPNSSELGSEPTKGEKNHSSKRLKRMKDRMREMIQWCDEAMHEGEEEDDGAGCEENNNDDGDGNNIITEEECAQIETEEAVSVERNGDCLIIHFKCPCNKAYQILLSGKNCYYKLM
ncbi:hypothetical protein U1Q18_001544 [Sarracenia purpurea var. burkii]